MAWNCAESCVASPTFPSSCSPPGKPLPERIIGLDSGADDYIVKPFDPDEVIARAEAVLRRVKGKVQQVLTGGNITLNETTGVVTVDEQPVSLSQAQTALLSTFMRHPNQVLSRDRLISLTFNNDFDAYRPRHRQPHRPPAQANQPQWQTAHPYRLWRWLPLRAGGAVMSLRWRIMGATVISGSAYRPGQRWRRLLRHPVPPGHLRSSNRR